MKFLALWISAICILIFVAQQLVVGMTDSLLLDQESFSQPWRFITSIFLHGNIAHLLYNLIALAVFGSVLEKKIGPSKFLILFLGSGILANLVAVQFYEASLGASGAIFGVLGALTILDPFLMVWAIGVPMPMVMAAVFWVIGDISGLFSSDGVGHVAHLSGIAVGILMGVFLRKPAAKRQSIYLDEKEMRRWEDWNLRQDT